jgi:hypothetical protein
MKREEMTQIVNEELRHIPRTGRHIYDGQARLRGYYNAVRREGLKLGKTKEETLAECIALVKKHNPSWQPVFDKALFLMQESEVIQS